MAWIHDSDGLYANSPYSPAPQNPSYGNQGGNPYGYTSSSPSPSPTVVGVPVYSNTLNQNAGYASVNTNVLAATDTISAKISPAKPIGMIRHNAGDISFELNTRENGQDVKLEFCPERDITVRELMNINLLIAALSNGIALYPEDPMIYVRKHNLERHFKFTV